MFKFKNLAPKIYRQRLVIEGHPGFVITESHITEYLSELSEALKMKTLIEPVTSRSDQYGWAGWIHWEASGAHFYAWDKPALFFSIDIYTCKRFDPKTAVNLTDKFFKPTKMVHRSF